MVGTVKWVKLHYCANSVEIAQTMAEILWFFDFQDGGHCHLGFSKIEIFQRWKRSRGSDCITVPNFVEIVWTAVEICEFQYYASFAWKCLFTLFLRGGRGWGTFPQMMSLIILTPKRTILGLNHVIWAINCEYRSCCSSWALEQEKRTEQDRTGKKSERGFTYLWNSPH